MEKKKILLVEDNKDDILLIQRVFYRTKMYDKYDLIIKEDGNQAIQYIKDIFIQSKSEDKDHPIHFLLLDLKLPKIDGFQILQKIRDNKDTKYIPVIIFTSSREDKDITKAYLMGANGYVRKPIDSERFTSVLQQIVMFWGDVNELPNN